MCGIVGIVNTAGSHPVDSDLLTRMTESIRHRGPDDGGIWIEGPVGLGSRRLAVIDLSPKGHQPMTNEDGSLVIVFNGEIYNFQSLRADLAARGHQFRSDTDTETILHAYEEHGIDSLKLLRGMFAFAIWDRRRKSLFVGRDRLGKKPMYYRAGRESFSFASEPKALLQDRSFAAMANLNAIDAFLTLGYVPGEMSAFSGVSRLLPGHWMRLDGTGLTIEPYWKLRYTPKQAITKSEACAEATRVLDEAVRLRMISDVPIGAHLSGGIDSSFVVGMMSRHSSRPVRTFSIGFDDPDYSELVYARQVAEAFGTEHHELVVKPDTASILPKMVWHYNEPFADSSALPSFYLCQMTRTAVTVALNGDGGDETFLGYDRYRAMMLADRWSSVPPTARALVARTARAMKPGSQKSTTERARRFAAGLDQNPSQRYASWMTLFDRTAKEALYSDEFRSSVNIGESAAAITRSFDCSDATNVAERAAHTDSKTYLPDDLLVKMDIASMAHSLEVRSPLLDHVVVEFAASLPLELKLRGSIQKHLLRELMRKEFPPDVLRRKKMGFAVPIDRWFRGELHDMAADILLDGRARARGYFRSEAVSRLLNEHVRGVGRHPAKLWALLVLELWHRTFIDQRCPVSA
jgi:asparagine synthase (glutamine-hydrolysing)